MNIRPFGYFYTRSGGDGAYAGNNGTACVTIVRRGSTVMPAPTEDGPACAFAAMCEAEAAKAKAAAPAIGTVPSVW